MDNHLKALTDYVSRIEAENAGLKAQLARAGKIISALRELMEALEMFERLAEAPTLTMFVTPKAKYGKRMTEEEIDTFCSEYQVEHLKLDAIAARHGVCAQTVRDHLGRRGIYHTRQDMALAERDQGDGKGTRGNDEQIP